MKCKLLEVATSFLRKKRKGIKRTLMCTLASIMILSNSHMKVEAAVKDVTLNDAMYETYSTNMYGISLLSEDTPTDSAGSYTCTYLGTSQYYFSNTNGAYLSGGKFVLGQTYQYTAKQIVCRLDFNNFSQDYGTLYLDYTASCAEINKFYIEATRILDDSSGLFLKADVDPTVSTIEIPIEGYSELSVTIVLNAKSEQNIAFSVNSYRYGETIVEEPEEDTESGSNAETNGLLGSILAFLQSMFDNQEKQIETQEDTNVLQEESNSLQEESNDLQQTQNDLQQTQNELTDEMMHGYDTTASNSVTGEFDLAIADYNHAESEITDTAIGNLGNYTIPEKGLAAYATQLVTSMSLVSSMLQSIFDSAGDFTIIISVGFATVIVSMIVGLYKFFS